MNIENYSETVAIRPIIDELLERDRLTEYPGLSREAIRNLERMYALRDPQKVDVLLAAVGDKPATFITIDSPTWEKGEDAKEVPPKNEAAVRSVAEALGLHVMSTDRVLAPSDNQPGILLRYMVMSRSSEITAETHQIVSESIDVTDSGYHYDEISLGTLLGFPKTAVEAYAEGRSHVNKPSVKDLEIHTFATYALSEKNEAEELLTGKQWAPTIKILSPILYNKRMDEMASHFKENGVTYEDPRRRMGKLYARFLRSRDI